MRLLTSDSTTYELTPEQNEIEDIRYCVLSCANSNDIDYYFEPLLNIQEFKAASIVLCIDQYTVKVPYGWKILVCDIESGDSELLPITSIRPNSFTAFVFDPISGYMPKFHPVETIGVRYNVDWCVPVLRNGHLLGVPLNENTKECVFFANDDKTNKISEVLDIKQLW